MDSTPVNQDEYIDNAIRAVQRKKQIPEIDFTLHTMEDGTQVSTQERVCKGTDFPPIQTVQQHQTMLAVGELLVPQG